MVTIEEALRLIQDQETHSSIIDQPLAASLDYYLAAPVLAPFDLPVFDNSAMDGYAICGSGMQFEIVGEVAAGSTAHVALETGKAMRIFTGGKVPDNTTSVIMQEKTEVEGSTLKLHEEVPDGKNIRKKGEEIAQGQQVFSTGHKLNAATIGVLSSLGLTSVKVFQKPIVHIIATGNELINPGEEKKEGQIYESNSRTLAAGLVDHGFNSSENKQLEDKLEVIREGIANSLRACDVLLLSGGISVGDYDYVKQALDENGVKEVFYKVLQKPGKPLYFGKKENQYVFALPGNPASSLTCFYIYVLPLLQKLAGGGGEGLMRLNLPLSHAYEVKGDRPVFLKGKINDGKVEILDGQGSSMIHSMAEGNALVYVKNPKKLSPGEPLECILI